MEEQQRSKGHGNQAPVAEDFFLRFYEVLCKMKVSQVLLPPRIMQSERSYALSSKDVLRNLKNDIRNVFWVLIRGGIAGAPHAPLITRLPHNLANLYHDLHHYKQMMPNLFLHLHKC